MTFEEAMRLCPPGYYFKSSRDGWSEYCTQYGVSTNGTAYWTAGCTAGGDLTKADIERLSKESRNGDDYQIYSHFGSTIPVNVDTLNRRNGQESNPIRSLHEQEVIEVSGRGGRSRRAMGGSTQPFMDVELQQYVYGILICVAGRESPKTLYWNELDRDLAIERLCGYGLDPSDIKKTRFPIGQIEIE